VALLDRQSHQCPAIIDARSPDGLAMVCAGARVPGSAWCAEHHARFVTLEVLS
jgi:hypothetical protein